MHNHGCLAYTGAAQQGGLNFRQLDAITPKLDLLVSPSQELYLPVFSPTHSISGAIHTPAGVAEGVGNKTLCCKVRPSQISACHSIARNKQLTGNAHWDRLENGVQNIDLVVIHGSAD